MTDTTVRSFSATSTESRPVFVNFFLERYEESFRIEISQFLSAIDGGEVNYPTFEDGRKALILANAAFESAESGKTVDISF